MPRFTTVPQRSRAPEAFSNSPRAEAEDFGGGLGEAIASFGEGAAKLGQVVKKRQELAERQAEREAKRARDAADAESVVYRSGVLVQIPQPERFAIHKLIVADRRRKRPDDLKSIKDRLQAEFLIKILAEDRPDDLKEAFHAALATGTKWQERIDRSLARMPDTKEILLGL